MLKGIFSDISPQTKETKEKINTWDYIKGKSFCTGNETIKKPKKQPTKWRNIFANYTSDKELSKIYKEFILLNTKKKPIQLKYGQRI